MNSQVTEDDLMEVRRLQANPLPGQEPRARTLLGQYLLELRYFRDVVALVDTILASATVGCFFISRHVLNAPAGGLKSARG